MRGGVHFDDIDGTAVSNRRAHVALATWTLLRGSQTIYCLGEQTGNGGFADSTRPCKEIGMPNAPINDGIAERAHNMLLTDKFCKCL
jgi:hypothetical protein